MLTSELYWKDWQPRNTWGSIVATLRQVKTDQIRNEVLAHVVCVYGPQRLFTVDFKLSSLYVFEPPMFNTVEEAKAYAHMTCLLILKEN